MKIVAFILLLFAVGMTGVRYGFSHAVTRHFGVSLLASFAMIVITGTLVHSPIVFLGTCFAAFFIGLKSPFDAACRFIALSILTPHVVYHANVSSAYILAIHPTLIFLIGLIFSCSVMPVQKKPRTRLTAEDGVVAALVLIAIMGEARNPSVTAMIRTVLEPVISLMMPYFYLTRSIHDRTELRIFFGVVAGCAAILSVFSLYEAKFAWSLFDQFWANFQPETFLSRNLRVRSGLLRTPTTFNESTAFAVFQVVGVIATYHSRRLFRSATAWLLCCGLVTVGLLAAQSRGALIGLAIGVTAILLFQRSYARATAILATAGSAVVGLLIFAKYNSKAASFVNADAALTGEDYRQQLLWKGLQEGMRHFWIGQDGDQVKASMVELTQGEHIVDFVNTYLTFFLHSGVLGVASFVIPLILVVMTLWNRRDLRRTDPTAREMEVVVGALVAVCTTLLFTSFYERNPLWLIVALVGAKVLKRSIPQSPQLAGLSMISQSNLVARPLIFEPV